MAKGWAMKPVLVDIDVLVDFLCGSPRAVTFMEIFDQRIILSSIVVAELCAGARDEDERTALGNFLSLYPVVPVSDEVARAGAAYLSHYGPLHGTSLAHAILAATAEIEGAELKTLSTGQYPMFTGLEPAYTK